MALRVPAHPLARALLEAVDLPIAAPSANRSGRVSPTEAAHVHEEFGDRVRILDGGACAVGIESTVVDMTGDVPAILRPGAVTEVDICHRALVTGAVSVPAMRRGDKILAPGMLASHYAPSKPLRLNVVNVQAGEGLLAFGSRIPPGAAAVENLSPSRDLREAAANLFRMLRRLDASPVASIAAMPVPEEGLGVAINDRLRRAAAPKE